MVRHVKTNQQVASFYVDRARDFQGICWESNSYNIWVQSGDSGIVGYLFEAESWTRDNEGTMERPEDIISKYDF